jgi:hypothetical protein
LFGIFNVMGHTCQMLSCRKSKHPVRRKCCLPIMLIFTYSMFMINFFYLGMMYVTIVVFWELGA